MFGFFLKMIIALLRFGGSLTSDRRITKVPDLIKCISLNNRACQAIVNNCQHDQQLSIQTLINLFIIYLQQVLISLMEVVILLMIHMLEYVIQTKQKL